ncbi:hypothetical protein [Pleionea sp. CnH1-48]|uniref:hypothetical protein n=1 Tax=Pleionea sp. CnH1-48 TaxID=2954494 RepID=UPI002097C3D8|nr:hypothetical protein [Pleionea sp. CnH1-48]MCO7227566.1 hypothetical protein [Pleionea sp. CnH1-48]
MLLLENERYLIECTLKIGTYPKDGPRLSFEQGLMPLLDVIKKGESVYEIRNGTASLIIEDFIEYENSIMFLLKYSDGKKSDPSFANLKTGESRVVKKEKGEGIAVSSHLLVSKVPNPDFPGFYDALLEEVPGITRTLIGSAFNRFLSIEVEYTFVRKSSGNEVQCRPLIDLQLNMSHNIDDCLKGGILTGFVAVQHAQSGALDEDGELKVYESRLVIKAKKSKKDYKDKIMKAIKYATENKYQKLTIKYRDENKRQKSLDMSTSRDALKESFFSKVKKIRLSNPIMECQDEFHPELCKKMKENLSDMS